MVSMNMSGNSETPTAAADQDALAAALLDPTVYGDPSARVEKLETHISYVFLVGAHAYKIKKAVDLGFLDFRTLAARRFYCQEELRLNRRLAPALYLDVVAITGTPEHPVLGGEGAPIEYAVKMRRFPQEQLFNALLARGRLAASHLDELAEQIAAFHARAAAATPQDAFGTPEAVGRPALENFEQIRATPPAPPDAAGLDSLYEWTAARLRALDGELRARKQAGFVRECHGDFHLGNVALVDGDVTIFDCLEFSENLRWIDVVNEIAFMVMDLHDKRRPDLAARFLNRYLEITGDYAGLRLLGFYTAYRALVRAKVHWLRARQPGVAAGDEARLLAQFRGYVGLARAQSRPSRAAIILTHGFSGSGKTTHTQSLLETVGAVRIRSDIERKRLHGLEALARTGSGLLAGAYGADATERTYERLLELAEVIAGAGYPVIVDATFLKRAQREPFRRLAHARDLPFAIIDFVAGEAVLRERIGRRERRREDASEAGIEVLEHQLAAHEPFEPDERAAVITYDAGRPPGEAPWTPVLHRLS